MRYWEGESVAVWRRRWNVPHVEVHESLPSTNERARELARDGAAPFSVVIAEAQTAGKGRSGKRWDSPAGMGLWLSFLLRVGSSGEATLGDAALGDAALGDAALGDSALGDAALVPILVGIAVARAIEALCPTSAPGIKWPNDVELDGRKVAGILCEGEGVGTLVVGIGVNVRQSEGDFAPTLHGRAISLAAAGCRVDRGELARALLTEARLLLDPLPGLFDEALRRELGRRDTLIGRMVNTDAGPEGRAMGISSDGALRVEVDGVSTTIRSGSVRVDARAVGKSNVKQPGEG